MKPEWTPKTQLSVADAGVAVNVELGGVRREDIELTVEANQLRVSGRSEDLGSFESWIDVPSGHDLANAKASYHEGILRIDVPRQKDPPRSKQSLGTS